MKSVLIQFKKAECVDRRSTRTNLRFTAPSDSLHPKNHPVPPHRTSGIIFKSRLAKLRVNPWYLVDVILMICLYSVSMSPMY